MSGEIAKTPQPPYYAVIFSSLRTEGDNGYGAMAERMEELAKAQTGFLGIESAREDLGITVGYFAASRTSRPGSGMSSMRKPRGAAAPTGTAPIACGSRRWNGNTASRVNSFPTEGSICSSNYDLVWPWLGGPFAAFPGCADRGRGPPLRGGANARHGADPRPAIGRASRPSIAPTSATSLEDAVKVVLYYFDGAAARAVKYQIGDDAWEHAEAPLRERFICLIRNGANKVNVSSCRLLTRVTDPQLLIESKPIFSDAVSADEVDRSRILQDAATSISFPCIDPMSR